MSTEFYLGVHGGRSETVAVLADVEGRLVSASRTGGEDLHRGGGPAAKRVLETAVFNTLRTAEVDMAQLSAAVFGIFGVSRPWASSEVAQMVAAICPLERCRLESAEFLPLRAATKDAVGVSLVAGVSTDCVGRDRYGRRHHVGGMGPISGDVGNLLDLAHRTMGGAWMASDGRTGPSALAQGLCEALEVERVSFIPRLMKDGTFPEVVIRRAVDCLFDCAASGDGLANRIIEDTGSRLGAAAVAAMKALLLRGSNAVVVLSGCVLQNGRYRALWEPVKRRIETTVSEAHMVALDVDPVIGAVLLARDMMDQAPRAFAVQARKDGEKIEALCEGVLRQS